MRQIKNEAGKILKEIGLSDKEIKVYLAGLEMDHFTVGSIAKMTSLKRPNCYVIVETLISKGLVSEVPRFKKKRYKAELPSSFANSLKMKAEMIEELSSKIKTSRDKIISSKVRFFSGKMGLEHIYKDILDKRPKLVESCYDPDKLEQIMGYKWASVWGKARRKNSINVLNILPHGRASKPDYGVSRKDRREVYELPLGINPKIAITTYGNTVGFICDSKDIMSFLIESKEFADTIKEIFFGLKMISQKKK